MSALVCVTGGAGFIGSHFIRYILQNTDVQQVLNIDSLTYAGNLETLSDIDKDPRYSFLKADINDREAVVHALTSLLAEREASASPFYLVNFAAESHVDRSIESSREFVVSNIEGTTALLDVFKSTADLDHDIYLQISTDEVYGSLGKTGFFTEDSPLQPNSPYAASKTSADLMVRAYHHTHGLPVRITRCSNNFGPYQFPEKLIPLMICNCLEGKELPVYGDGKQVREWIHAQDHSSAVWAVLTKGKNGEIYNIGSGNEVENIHIVKSLCKIVAELSNKSEEDLLGLIRHVTDRLGHDRRYAIDPSKTKRELGWECTVSFDQGLRDTIAWYINNPTWVSRVRDGSYRDYYQRMYGER